MVSAGALGLGWLVRNPIPGLGSLLVPSQLWAALRALVQGISAVFPLPVSLCSLLAQPHRGVAPQGDRSPYNFPDKPGSPR